MKLIINISGNYVGGGFQVAVSFLNEIKEYTEHTFYIFLGNNFANQVDKSTFPENFIFYDIPVLKWYKLNKYLNKIEKKITADVVFSVFGPSFYKSQYPQLIGYAQGYYIYPESPFWKYISIRERTIIRLKKILHLYFFKKQADAIVAETEDATNRIKKILGGNKKYFTVSNTCSKVYSEPINDDIKLKLSKKNNDEYRLLTLSRYYAHKNIDKIPQIILHSIR